MNKLKKRYQFLLSMVFVLPFACSMSACDNTTTTEPEKPNIETPVEPETPNVPETPVTPETPTTPEPEPVYSISFEEFMDDHSETAIEFANRYLKDDLLNNKTPLSQTWGFHANENDELDSVSLTYTYSTSATERAIDVANATFTNPIDLDKIVEESYVESELANAVTRQTAFEFDAKESYHNSTLASTLFAMYGSENEPKFFSEVESEEAGERAFKVAEETSSAVNVYNIYVKGETNAEIIANLENDDLVESFQYATYPLGDKESVTINTASYIVEEFAPENVQEIANDYSTEIKQALDENCLETAGKNGFGNSFTTDKLVEYCWDIGDGETISEVKLIATYKKYSDTTAFSVMNVKLKKSIDVKDLTKENIANTIENSIENATYSQEYYFSFNPATQEENNALANAIFQAYGMSLETPEGATRYLIDKGSYLDDDLGETNRFTVVEIREGGINEFTIIIKNSVSDEAYINKLENTNNFKTLEEKSCEMTGNKIGIEDEVNTQSEEN